MPAPPCGLTWQPTGTRTRACTGEGQRKVQGLKQLHSATTMTTAAATMATAAATCSDEASSRARLSPGLLCLAVLTPCSKLLMYASRGAASMPRSPMRCRSRTGLCSRCAPEQISCGRQTTASRTPNDGMQSAAHTPTQVTRGQRNATALARAKRPQTSMHALRLQSKRAHLAADEHVVGVGVRRVVAAGHGVKRTDGARVLIHDEEIRPKFGRHQLAQKQLLFQER